MKNTKMHRLAALLLAMVLLLSLTACQTTDGGQGAGGTSDGTSAPAETTAGEAQAAGVVTVEIRCDETVPEEIWPDAVILEKTEYAFTDDVDAFTVLTEVAKENNIVLVDSGGYVTGIGGLSTGDAGDSSGWMFQVNGKLAEVGAQDYILQDGDALVWFYTADYNVYFG